MKAEKILDEHYASGMHWKTVNRDNVLLAMKEYASQAVRLALEEASKQAIGLQQNRILSLADEIIDKLK